MNSNGLGADSDPYGNACDPDLDNDGDVDEADLQLLRWLRSPGSVPGHRP